MPDSFPPLNWGPPPFDERDLDAVLSGETVDVPIGLRQVADALSALRAAPAPAELSGEATIMAEFRALADFRARGLSDAARAAGQAHTLELPVLPSDLSERRGARHRVRRTARRSSGLGRPSRSGSSGPSGPLGRPGRTARRLSRPAATLMSAAAVVVIVAAAAVAGILPSPIQHLARHATSTASASSSAVHNSGAPNVQGSGSATAEPTAHPTTSHSATSQPQPQQPPQTRLCDAFFGYLRQPLRQRAPWAESAVLWQLSKLAGGYNRIFKFCASSAGDLHPHGSRTSPNGAGSNQGAAGVPGQGSQSQGQPASGTASQPAATAQPAPSSNANSGNGSGKAAQNANVGPQPQALAAG